MMFIIQIIQRGLISFNEFTVACRCFNIRALALLMPLKPLKRSCLCDISLFDNWKSICTVLPYLSDNQWMLIPFFVKCWFYPPKWAWKSSMKGKQARVSQLKGEKKETDTETCLTFIHLCSEMSACFSVMTQSFSFHWFTEEKKLLIVAVGVH